MNKINYKYFITIIILLYAGVSHAQTTILISKGDVKINNTIIRSYFTIDDYIKLLGQPTRKELRNSLIYYYDNLGLVLGTMNNSKYISVISIYFNDNTEIAPFSSYKGWLTIGGYSITSYTSLNSLKNIDDLYIKTDKVLSSLGVYEAAIGTNFLMLIYDPADKDNLFHIEIGLK